METQLTTPKKYVKILKSKVDRDVVEKQLLKLVNKIETGEKWEVMIYFHLLCDDINYMDKSNLELILLYVLNVLSESTRELQIFDSYVDKHILSVFGTYLISDEIKNEFLKLCCQIVRFYKNMDITYFSAYEQLTNSVDSEIKGKIKEFVIKNVESRKSENFYKEYNDGDYLPF